MSPARQGGSAPLSFRGGPHHVTAVLPGRTAGPALATARLTRGGGRARGAAPPVEVTPVVVPIADQVMMQLPPGTAPGTYRGVLSIDGGEREIVVEVEPHVQVDADPPRLELTGRPGQRLSAQVVATNRGNVPVELQRANACGLFDEGGIECAIGRAAVAELAPGERRIDRFADALAEMHGGLVRINADAGTGPLLPGESRTVRLSLTVPERLKPGHVYSGRWALDTLQQTIRITVPDAAGRKEAGK